jgi:hypothetical protein
MCLCVCVKERDTHTQTHTHKREREREERERERERERKYLGVCRVEEDARGDARSRCHVQCSTLCARGVGGVVLC